MVTVMEAESIQAPPGRNSDIAWCLALLMIPVLCGLLGYEMCDHFQMPHDPASYLGTCGASLMIIGIGVSLLQWRMLHQIRVLRQQIATLQQQAAGTQLTQAAMVARAEAYRQLRHDIRGALSPALLTADRLLTNSDPAVKRAGEIMVRAVERAAALMADPPPEVKISPPDRP
jgi:hypothetical protein